MRMAQGGCYTINTIDRPAVYSFQERAGKSGGAKESCCRINEQEHCQPSTAKASAFKQGNGSKAGSIGFEEEKSPTLSAQQAGRTKSPPFLNETYGISSFESNAMKSANPHSGIYKAETARTLDLNGGNASCNQGGTIVMAVDCRNGREQEINGTLQAKGSGGTSYNLNNVVRETSV